MTHRVAVVFALGTLAVGSAATAQEHPGAEPYKVVCQSCHGEKGRGDIAPPLVPLAYDADYVLAIVREGYGQMPPISTRELTDEQVRQVAAYLASILEESPEPKASRAEDALDTAY